MNDLSPVFHEEFDIDSKMSNYILNIEKFSKEFIPEEEDMVTVLEGLSKSVVSELDSTMMKSPHFTIPATETRFQSGASPSKRTPNSKRRVIQSVDDSMPSSGMKTPVGRRERTGRKNKPTNEIETIKFKNFQDLQYDYNKFGNSAVETVILEMHGNNLN